MESFGLKSTFTIGLLDGKHILIRFIHEEDYQRIWLREHWYVRKFLMRIFKWTPDFRVDVESSIALIWVSFHGFPVHFFSETKSIFYC